MNQKNENDPLRRSPLSYELIIRNNQAPQENGAPHLILRRKLKDANQQNNMETTTPAGDHSEKSNLEINTSETQVSEIEPAHRVADYISSLHHHVPDEVVRVVDAIIEEEGKLPNNLPKLDDKLSAIFPGSDVEGMPGDDLFFERADKQPTDVKTSKYTNRVEYEDL